MIMKNQGCIWIFVPAIPQQLKCKLQISVVRSKFSNTRFLSRWFFFNLFSSQVVTTGTNSYLMRKVRVTVYKVPLQMTLLSCQSSCIVIVPSQPANHVRLRMTVPAYQVCAFELFAQLQNHFLPKISHLTRTPNQYKRKTWDPKVLDFGI